LHAQHADFFVYDMIQITQLAIVIFLSNERRSLWDLYSAGTVLRR
jgi:hypothetical protein